MQGAGGIGGLLTQVDIGAVKSYAYLYDGNGNVGQLIDNSDGSIDAHYEYDPYGREILSSGAAAAGNPYRFSTKYLDSEYGFYYYGRRYYDPETGRWLNRDPIEERGGFNLMAFSKNNPVDEIDLLGLAIYAFDGTWQNKDGTDKNGQPARPTNVAKLYKLYDGDGWYQKGVGTSFGTKLWGGLTGFGGRNHVTRMYKKLVEIYNTPDSTGNNQQIDVIGYSRGAALARAFVNYINQRGGVQILDSNGRQTSTYCPVKIRFLGLFDTVASFGIAGNNINLGYNLSIPPNVLNVRQATAEDEQRSLFPLSSVLSDPNNPTLDPRIVEQEFQGTHGNIGGGEANSDLSKAALQWMHREATALGVPFRPLSPSDLKMSNPAISPTGGKGPRDIYYK